MIPNFTIYSDKVYLTANYYIEYLGFNLLYKVEEDENPYVWLELNGQFLLIWPWDNKLGIARPVELEVTTIHDLYLTMMECVRINEPLVKAEDGRYNFSVLDCEGNIIYFSEQTSSVISAPDGLNTMQLAFDEKNN